MTEEARFEAPITEIEAPPCEVSVMEDRARVTRRARVTSSTGRHRLRIRGVAPVIVDKTLVVVADSGKGAIEVIDARVIRRLASAHGPEGGDSLPSVLHQLRDERVALQRSIDEDKAACARKAKQAKALVGIGRHTLADATQDVAYGRVVAEELEGELARLRSRYAELADQLVRERGELEDKQALLARLDFRIAKLETPSDCEWACIEIDVEVARECDGMLQIDYTVPNACWRPYHRARLTQGETVKVEFQTDACVWQNTGEDWSEVELCFSTERSSLGVEPPSLATDTLRTQKRSAALQVEAREQSVESVPDAGERGPARLPGIDDGGLSLMLRAKHKCSLPSDGRPHRIYLSEFEAAATLELVAMPELEAAVVLASSLENTGDTPLLAGPVDLVRESGLVGRSKILYVPSGERFDLGWGPEADLRVRREVDETAETSRALSSWSAKTYKTKIKLSNLGQSAHSMRVVERVPVSEIDKLKIEVDKKATTGAKDCDANGFVEWHVELGPSTHQDIALSYTVKKHDDVVN